MKIHFPISKAFCFTCAFFVLQFIVCTPRKAIISGSSHFSLQGTLVNQEGKAAANAVVCLYRSDYLKKDLKKSFPSDADYMERTDKSGKYKFRRISKGYYTIIMNREDKWRLLDSVLFDSEHFLTINDTLKESGSLYCSIKIAPYHTCRKYSIQLVGTPFYSTSDKDGVLSFGTLPAGNYNARITAEYPGYGPKTRILHIIPGRKDTLTDTLKLPFTGIPSVEFTRAFIDTASGTVQISWQSTYDQVKDFLVFRKLDYQESFGLFPVGLTSIQRFADTLFSSHGRKETLSSRDTLHHRCIYYVRIRNKTGKTGPAYDTISLTAVSQAWVNSETSLRLSRDTLSINDTLCCGFHFKNRTRPITKVKWKLDGEIVTHNFPKLLDGSDTIQYYWPTPGTKKILVKTIDNSGSAGTDTASVAILLDPPKALAGKDTTVGLNDPIKLHAGAVQRFGRIIKWEWSIGGSEFITVSSGDTIIRSPRTPVKKFKCVLRVTDDDLNTGLDTMDAAVISIPPKVHAYGDSLVGLFEPIHLGGTATDNGQIETYEWDIGNTGRFIRVSKPDTVIPALKSVNNRYVNVLRVTDDDGETGTDTVISTVALLWGRLSSSPRIPELNGQSALAFNNAMWIIGGQRSCVWNSQNGKEWNAVADKAQFGNISGQSCVAFQGRMWIFGGKKEGELSSEIWSSNEGGRWELEGKTPFPARQYHASVVFNNNIWIIGGLGEPANEPCFNDVWKSPDGKHWEEVTDSAAFSRRYGLGTVVFHDSLIVIGGFYDGLGGSVSLSDVWQSGDGVNWKRLTEFAGLTKNRFRSYVTFDNRIWTVGGYCRASSQANFNDVWYSSNGAEWTRFSITGPSCERDFISALVFGNHIWVIPSEPEDIWYIR